MIAPLSFIGLTFECAVCKRRYSKSFLSIVQWETDAMKGLENADICMKCKSPPPNDGGTPGTPTIRKAA